MSNLGFEVRLVEDFEAAIARVTEALRAQGFGVLTRIDLHTAFAEKIGAQFRRYAILGACNPGLAYAALSQRADLGLLLPCNVTVEEAGDGGSIARFVDPATMMAGGGMDDDAVIAAVAAEAAGRFRQAAAALSRP